RREGAWPLYHRRSGCRADEPRHRRGTEQHEENRQRSPEPPVPATSPSAAPPTATPARRGRDKISVVRRATSHDAILPATARLTPGGATVVSWRERKRTSRDHASGRN